jgi:ankyrin
MGHLRVAHVLFEHSPDTTAETEDGRTPLHMASMEGHVELVQFLLERGADATVQAKDGRTPLDLATEKEQVEVELSAIFSSITTGALATVQDDQG